MSFVGAFVSENGVVAFSDSRLIQLGGISPSILNDTTKKILKGEDFVITIAGTGVIRKECSEIPLWLVIEEELEAQSHTLVSLMDALYDKTKDTIILNHEIEYYFVAGIRTIEYGYKSFAIREIRITNKGVEWGKCLVNDGFLWFGSPLLSPWVNESFRTKSVEELKEFARDLVEINEKYGDKYRSLNSVGGKIQIETLV